MAKAPKTPKKSPDEPTEISEVEALVIPAPPAAEVEALVIPAPLTAALEENDTVMQAHLIRQANHFEDMAPSLAKQAREDQEREAQLQDHQKIRAEWDANIAAQKAEQEAREEREGAADRIAILQSEIAEHETSLMSKSEELERLQKLVG